VLAEQVLAELGVTPAVVAGAARLGRLTVAHDPEPGDTAGEVLCDADLAVLARDRHGYAEYVATVRSEYAQYDAATFRLGRAAVLRDLLALPSLFCTAAGRDRWEAAARANVEREITELGWCSHEQSPAR
jgi:predicted metal-dependent HD superfamily phosphohydrolase